MAAGIVVFGEAEFKLVAAGKKTPVVVAAIAREMAAFLWAISRQVEPLT